MLTPAIIYAGPTLTVLLIRAATSLKRRSLVTAAEPNTTCAEVTGSKLLDRYIG